MDERKVVGSSVAAVLMTVLAHTRAFLRRFTLQAKEGLTMDARRVVGLIVAAVLMTALVPVGAFAQATGTISGQVRKTGGVPVPEALVTFTDESDPVNVFTSTTDSEGRYEIASFPTAVEEVEEAAHTPSAFRLGQNYPNPFNPTTTIPFSLEKAGFVELSIYNALGQKVRTLISSPLSTGSHAVQWDCLDDGGKSVAAGVYIYRLRSGGQVQSRKMVLVDGGGQALSRGTSVAKPAHSAAKKAAATYRVAITGEGIAPFEQGGITLTAGQTLNFTVFPKDGLLLTTVVGNAGYVSTVKDLDVGAATNEEAYEIASVGPTVFIYNEMVFVSEHHYGDKIHRYERGEDGELIPAGVLTMPEASHPSEMEFVSPTKAYVSLYAGGKLVIINQTEMIITGEIDISEYAVGEDDNNPEPCQMVIRDGKLFVGLNQNISQFSAHPSAYVLIVDVATDTVEKMITDERACQASLKGSSAGMFVDDAGDIYVYCGAFYGYQPDVIDGFLRIRKGETEFDPDYFFSIQELSLPDVPDNKGLYLSNMVYTGGSTVCGIIMIPGWMGAPPDYVNDRPYQPFKLDLSAQTAEKIGLSPSNGWSRGVCGYDNKVVFGISSVDGDGLYTYDPKTGAVSSKPVVTTVGFPFYIMAF